MKHLILIFAAYPISLSFAQTQNSPAPTPPSSTTSPASPTTANNSSLTPMAVCQSMAQAAKNGDFKAYQNFSFGAPQHKGNKAGFDKMHQKYFDRLKDLSCTSENVSGNHAFVQASSQGQERLIPFKRTPDGWKFDAKTYMSFYDEGHPGNRR